MINQKTGHIPQTLYSLHKRVYGLNIFLIIFSVFEICFFWVGYLGVAVLKIKTGLWYVWSFLAVIFRLITPFIFIIAIACTVYLFFQLCRRGRNCRPAIVAAIATGTSLLSLLSIFVTDKLFYRSVINTYGNIKIEQKDWTGESLPSFTFQNIQEELAPLTVENLQGKTSILIFWATYNKPWSSNFQYAQELYNQREKLNINVFAIAVDKSKEDINKFLKNYPPNIPVYHDPNANYIHSLNIMGSIEKILIVDSETKVRAIFGAPDSLNKIKEVLDGIETPRNKIK